MPNVNEAGQSIEALAELAIEAARISRVLTKVIDSELGRGRKDTRGFMRFNFVENTDPMTKVEKPKVFEVIEEHDAKSQTIIRLTSRLEQIAYRIRVDSGIWTKNQTFD